MSYKSPESTHDAWSSYKDRRGFHRLPVINSVDGDRRPSGPVDPEQLLKEIREIPKRKRRR